LPVFGGARIRRVRDDADNLDAGRRSGVGTKSDVAAERALKVQRAAEALNEWRQPACAASPLRRGSLRVPRERRLASPICARLEPFLSVDPCSGRPAEGGMSPGDCRQTLRADCRPPRFGGRARTVATRRVPECVRALPRASVPRATRQKLAASQATAPVRYRPTSRAERPSLA
jgi:hypothetical protein